MQLVGGPLLEIAARYHCPCRWWCFRTMLFIQVGDAPDMQLGAAVRAGSTAARVEEIARWRPALARSPGDAVEAVRCTSAEGPVRFWQRRWGMR